jgi:adenosine deaminase
MLSYHNLKAMPKIDLHRHFEGSLRLETLLEIARQYDLDVPKSDVEALRPLVQVTNDPPNAHTFLAKFEVLRHFYRSPELIRRMAYEIVEDAANDNVHYLELRFSPQALSRYQGFPLAEVTDWVIDAVHQAANDYGMEVRLIVTLVRHDPVEQAKKVAEIALSRHNEGIVGLDLAGDEVNHSSLPYAPLFQEASQQGMGITIHAGEWTGAQSVRVAIEQLKANRIGHGVNIVADSEVVQLVRRHNVALELCLTSNMQTGSVSRIDRHPVRDFLQMDVPVTLNTDDPTISNIVLTDEYYIAMHQIGLSYADLRQMTMNAIHAAFLDAPAKRKLERYFERILPTPESVAMFDDGHKVWE